MAAGERIFRWRSGGDDAEESAGGEGLGAVERREGLTVGKASEGPESHEVPEGWRPGAAEDRGGADSVGGGRSTMGASAFVLRRGVLFRPPRQGKVMKGGTVATPPMNTRRYEMTVKRTKTDGRRDETGIFPSGSFGSLPLRPLAGRRFDAWGLRRCTIT